MTLSEEPSPPESLELKNRFQPDLSNTEFEIQFFEKIIDRSPDYIDVIRVLAENLGRNGQYKKSLLLDRKLVKLTNHFLAHYNLACSLSMLGYVDEAITELEVAIEKGYNDFGHLITDSDLAPLREIGRFQSLLSKLGTAV